MGAKTKVGGVWEDVVVPRVKVSGVWKGVKTAWVKVNGAWKYWFLQGGVSDPRFLSYIDSTFISNYGTGANQRITSMVVQPDGKIVFSGLFDSFNGVLTGRIVRLNPDGTRDTAFSTNVGTGGNNLVEEIALQSDGKIVVGGWFTTWNGVTVNRIVRLNADGTIDTNFLGNTGSGATTSSGTPFISMVNLQPDGKILLGGEFTFFNGSEVGRFVRLNPDGTRDTAFSTNVGTGAFSSVQSTAIQSDGKIVVGGVFTLWNGVTVNSIVRLNSDGTRDTTFTTNTGTAADNLVYSVLLQPDGKILVGGNFTSWNGTTVGRVVRLNTDGTRDTAFSTNVSGGANNFIESLNIQSDGKILIGGDFTTWNGSSASRVVRLNGDGTLDSLFAKNVGTASNSRVASLYVQSDGKIFVLGNFTTWNGISINRAVRLETDGTFVVPGFNNDVTDMFIQPDGKVLLCGGFTAFNGTTVNRLVRLNSDDTLDTPFLEFNGTGVTRDFSSPTINGLALQPDGKIIVMGAFTNFNNFPRINIARLNSYGTLDTSFTQGAGPNNFVYCAAVQSDGKILIGGAFTTYDGVTSGRIARLNTNGTVDTAFSTNVAEGFNGVVESIVLQPDGKILVGGSFGLYGTPALNARRFTRLNSDGTLDSSFTQNTSSDGNVYAVALQPDGKILLGGQLSFYGGLSVGNFIRINSDGTVDTAFRTQINSAANSLVTSIILQPDGKIIVGGVFNTWNFVSNANRIVRLNADGSRDLAFSSNIGSGPDSTILSLLETSNGRILVGGAFNTFRGLSRRKINKISGDISVS